MIEKGYKSYIENNFSAGGKPYYNMPLWKVSTTSGNFQDITISDKGNVKFIIILSFVWCIPSTIAVGQPIELFDTKYTNPVLKFQWALFKGTYDIPFNYLVDGNTVSFRFSTNNGASATRAFTMLYQTISISK